MTDLVQTTRRPQESPDDPLTTDNARKEIRFGIGVFASFFVLFLGWAAFAPLDAAVVAPGVVVVSGARQTVQHRDGGIISNILIEDGQRVEQGEILIELSAPEVLARKEALLSQVLDLQMQRAQLMAQQAGRTTIEAPREWVALPPEDRETAALALERHRREAAARRAALRSQRAGNAVDARIAGYQEEIVSLNRQDQLLEDELTGVRSLAERGLMPLTRVRALERAQAELDGRRAELRAAIATALEDRAEQVRDIEARLAQLLPQLAGARAELENTLLRAPVSGVIVGLHANTLGGVIRAGEPVMDIVPEGQDLIVEAHVRPEDADDVHPGLQSEVRITAFSGRSMPMLEGEVQRISADRFTDERTGAAYFLARVSVPQPELQRLADDSRVRAQVRPGLPAQVVIPTRKRTALQYFLEPLNQTLWGSFRES
ncbi:MAG TPA: HlyD family type I secretion periplasmic adaptor subunit [Vitreimonas sp.]|nr:HlyD family type I secretion periplasmic adaptor subunit [Vitreimonas sp.]